MIILGLPFCFKTLIDFSPITLQFTIPVFYHLSFQDGGGTEHRIKHLMSHLQQLMYEYICRSLFKADRLMFALHMVHGMKPELFSENVCHSILFNATGSIAS